MDRWSVVGDRNSVWPSMCADDIPEEVRYDATENPAGVRCTIFESMARFYGRDLDTGFALRALDNVGVQYGLGALNDGQITPEQFVDLNERIGGYDLDGQFVGDRTVGDVEAIRAGYRTGRVINGAGMDLPIIDLRVYMDDNGSRGVPDSGDVHTRFHSLEMRQRLINANGNAENQVIWIASPDEMSNGNLVASDAALDLMDDWLEALLADNSGATYRERVLRARPAELNDGCWDRDGAWISDSDVFNPESRCNTIYPYFANPRIIAGAPFTDDVVKCTLKPIDADDYAEPLTAGQLDRLRAVFPDGVCNYTTTGVGRETWAGPWQKF